jgi:hypothetical protein
MFVSTQSIPKMMKILSEVIISVISNKAAWIDLAIKMKG